MAFYRRCCILLLFLLAGGLLLLLYAPLAAGKPRRATNIDTSGISRSRFFATTVTGLEKVLANELRAIGAKKVDVARNGVYFDGDTKLVLSSVMNLRTALRVMEVVTEASQVVSKDDLYSMVSSVDWTEYLSSPLATLKCDTTLGRDVGRDLTHTHFCSLTVKNAIVDQFRDSVGTRPSVDLEDPELPLLLYLHRGSATLYRIWSGDSSLHKRGYRGMVHKAALRETTAAALLYLSNWPHGAAKNETFVDPMCGSGTLAIEAALISANVAPGLIRYGNSEDKNKNAPRCTRWPGVSEESWDDVWYEAKAKDQRDELQKESSPSIFVNDVEISCIELAIKAAASAGVHKLIDFSCRDISEYNPKLNDRRDLSHIITNPPWDLRIGGAEEAWSKLGEFAYSYTPDSIWALTGNPKVTEFTDMNVKQSVKFKASSVNMDFINFDM